MHDPPPAAYKPPLDIGSSANHEPPRNIDDSIARGPLNYWRGLNITNANQMYNTRFEQYGFCNLLGHFKELGLQN